MGREEIESRLQAQVGEQEGPSMGSGTSMEPRGREEDKSRHQVNRVTETRHCQESGLGRQEQVGGGLYSEGFTEERPEAGGEGSSSKYWILQSSGMSAAVLQHPE